MTQALADATKMSGTNKKMKNQTGLSERLDTSYNFTYRTYVEGDFSGAEIFVANTGSMASAIGMETITKLAGATARTQRL